MLEIFLIIGNGFEITYDLNTKCVEFIELGSI